MGGTYRRDFTFDSLQITRYNRFWSPRPRKRADSRSYSDRVGRGLTPQADEAAAEDMDVGCQDGILERRRTNGISRMAVDLINGAKEVQWRKITDPQPVNFHCRNEFKMGEEYPYRLTNGQYRQLTKQVKDINFQVANKYRPNVDYMADKTVAMLQQRRGQLRCRSLFS